MRPITSEKLIQGMLTFLCAYFLYHFGFYFYFYESSSLLADYPVYWKTAERLQANQLIYDLSDFSPFKYSPTFAYFFRYSFFLLNQHLSATLWMCSGLVLFVFFLWKWMKWLLLHFSQSARIKTLPWILLLSVGVSWRGFFETSNYGQVDLFLGAGLLYLFYQPENSRKLRHFLIGALVLSVKPHLGLFLIPYCFVFGLKAVFWTSFSTVLLYCLPLFWLGPSHTLELFQAWLRVLTSQDSSFLTENLNQNIGATLARLSHQTELVQPFIFTFILLYFFSSLALGVRQKTWSLEFKKMNPKASAIWFCIAASSYLVFSPLSWRWLSFFWVPILTVIWVIDHTRASISLVLFVVFLSAILKNQSLLSNITATADAASYLGLHTLVSGSLFLFSYFLGWKLFKNKSSLQ